MKAGFVLETGYGVAVAFAVTPPSVAVAIGLGEVIVAAGEGDTPGREGSADCTADTPGTRSTALHPVSIVNNTAETIATMRIAFFI